MLQQKFFNLIEKYSGNKQFNEKCWFEIERNYTHKSRHYHNLKHLEAMFFELENSNLKVDQLETLQFSIFYHDIIYNSLKSDNEYQSALLFSKRISNTTFPYLEECKTQIELTKAHLKSDVDDTNILMDLDLSILGKSSGEYEIYRKNIRKEYHIFPNFLYHLGRKKVLKSLLNQDTIYKTEVFQQKYEAQVKINLKRELDNLS
jgi:predicted metal-dependent HD superfamily phosphohydrolase